MVERGLIQRITALNLFLHDIYHEGKILREHVAPYDLVYSSKHYRREMHGSRPLRILRLRSLRSLRSGCSAVCAPALMYTAGPALKRSGGRWLVLVAVA